MMDHHAWLSECDACGEDLPIPAEGLHDGDVVICPDCGLHYTVSADAEGASLSEGWASEEETPDA